MKFNLSVIIATIILILGTVFGFIDTGINLRIMHTLLGVIFILTVFLGLGVHYNRLISKSPTDIVSWIHIFIFSILLFLSISAIRKWNFKHNHHEHYSNENFIVKYKGNNYNIKDFVPNHPGGSVINKAEGKDLLEVWKDNGVSWHENNENVKEILEQYKI